ncbi:hypothetical protein B0I35DRAFT_435555 [Stachybotrys elegans]|uniref:Capsule polysaccharide biosynthesis protein n=1 Tax=Stachybotrys elegans TaxID=80388 RepID=A0A8K0SNT4_9HYPO|nr:hypothetical protein B0I35DRAFT_435555 [Stachybotrys elegans]
MDYPQIPASTMLPYSPAALPSEPDPLPTALTSPPAPQRGGKNIFAFWHSGLRTLPPYLLRNVLAWYQRFSPVGWHIYVLDTVPDSPLNVANFIDTNSPSVVPEAFTKGTIGGGFVAQHTSDLVRFPLLLRYGGAYLDVSLLQFGDLNWLWDQHLANPDSPYEFSGYTMGDPPEHISIVNFAMMAIADCPLVLRAHRILLKLWEGKTSTAGAHASPLVSHVPLMRVPDGLVQSEDGQEKMDINDEGMTDYAIQIQCFGSAERWLDEAGGWNGPEYVRTKCWLYSMIDMAYVSEQLTGWNSRRQYELLATKLPSSGEAESDDQKLAREIVEKSIAQSWSLKLAHGFSAKLFGAPTLGFLWRANPGSDCADGTYAGWLRWAQLNLMQTNPPKPLVVPEYSPTMVASLDAML